MRQLEPARARTELGADEMAALQLVDGAIRNAVRSAGRGVHRSARAALRDERPFELRAQIALADAAGIRSRDDRVRVERRQDLVHIAERLQVSGRDLDHVLWQRIPQTPACDLKLDRLNVLALDLHQTPAGVDAHLEKIADELLCDSWCIAPFGSFDRLRYCRQRGLGAEPLEPQSRPNRTGQVAAVPIELCEVVLANRDHDAEQRIIVKQLRELDEERLAQPPVLLVEREELLELILVLEHRQKPRVEEGRLPGSRRRVEEHDAMRDHEREQLPHLTIAPEKERPVGALVWTRPDVRIVIALRHVPASGGARAAHARSRSPSPSRPARSSRRSTSRDTPARGDPRAEAARSR